ncbi:isochorismatase family cysteine hydrolase [Bacillus carboniphilus]|uniref:Isochorismatase family cysteine hydrolase n=1 Tax=Bacillus carboniphilus TaxID=86663 RepID=A0ABY9JZN0_9BACI|nr:isochorismatase family cysteine hydrolase [Bacillus carboniphilus]WLR43055.1 isochorismatase family cysteine hydrolase [Bacillus carboniphilus]
MAKALITIDYTNDFVAEDGALTCGEPARIIEPQMVELTEKFIQNNDYVFFATDVHERDNMYHPESELFPPHNLRGTKGRELFGRLKGVYESNKKNSRVIWLDKTRYSAFAGTNLEILLRERGIEELYLTGVCTDICVLHTAMDAYNKGFQIVVHQEAVASFNQAGHQWALDHFKSCLGAKVI